MSTTIAIEDITKERMLATPYAKFGSTYNSIIIDLLNNQCKHKRKRKITEGKKDEEVQS